MTHEPMISAPDASVPPVWVPTPPGWIEIAAFDTDERAEDHWRSMIEPVRSELGEAHAEDLHARLRRARAQIARAPVTSAGVVFTVVDEDLVVWSLSTTIRAVESRDLAPVALAERVLGRSAEPVEEVSLADGRSGVLGFLDADSLEPHELRAEMDRAEDRERSACVAAVSLPERPHDIVVVSGSAHGTPSRDLLAMLVVSTAAGVRVGPDVPSEPELGRVLQAGARHPSVVPGPRP